MLKQEFPPELDWFIDINVRVDLGYLGIQSAYKGDRIDIPTKKPRKSKKNPNPQLSDAQKAANTVLSQVRIFIADFRGAKSTHIPQDKLQCFQGKRMLFVRGFSA